jgi:hypothetical protein
VTTEAATAIGIYSGTLNGTVNPFGAPAAAWFEYGTTPSMGLTTVSVAVPANNLNNPVATALSGLIPNTIYYYRIVGQSSGGTSYGFQLSFTSLALPPVVVTGSPATNILQNSATLNGTANPNGVNGLAWFNYGLTTSYTLSSQTQLITGSVANSVVISIFGLTPLTTYHYQIAATNNGGTTVGSDATFTTLPDPPIVTTGSPATNMTQTSGTVGGTVNPNGVSATAWFEWGTSTSYGLSNSLTPESIPTGTTAVNLTPYTITGLTAYTAYHYRAVAKNTGGTTYGADALFTTLPFPPVIIGSPTASPIFQTTATLNGTVFPSGAPGYAFFNYGLTATYGSATSTAPISGSANMAVSLLVGNLSSLTTYHYQMVAYNAGGTVYGPDASFTTLAYPPLVITDYASNVGTSSAILNGQVHTNGLITSTWFEWGITTAYGISNKSAAQVLSPGSSYVALTPVLIGSLLPNTIYHFRAVAQSSAGITTGVDRYFTTQSGGISPPGLSYSPDPGYNSVLGYSGTNPYTFKVVYTSPSNLPPLQIDLYLDGGLYMYGLLPRLPMTIDSTVMGTFTSVSGGPVIDNRPVKDGIVGWAYTSTPNFTVINGTGTPPYLWSMTAGFGGTLPAGLSINKFTGELSGIPTVAGTYPLTITATDLTSVKGSVDINLNICSYTTGCQYQVSSPTSPTLLAGVGFYFFGASDGQSTISLSSSGTLAGPTVAGTPTSTPVGNNVVVTPTPGYAVKYPGVSTAGSTTLSSYLLSLYPIPSSYTVPTTNIYYQNISSTAIYGSGNISVCINYSSAYFINQNAIVMLHYEGSQWIDRTSSLDVVHNIVCGIVSSLSSPSPFALVMTGSTAVGLTSFTTTAGDGKVMIEWNTQTETNQLGFNILRGLSINGPFTQVNGSMVPARGNSIYGSHYRFMDYGVSNGAAYYYKLESLDTGSHSMIQFVSSATPHSADIALAKESLLVKESLTDTQQDQPALSGKGTGLSIIQTLKGEKVESGDGANGKAEDKTTTPLNLIQVNGKVMEDKVILSWIPMDPSDSYTVWRSEEKNGFYEIISDKLISPEVRGNMDENDYLIRCVYEDKALESGKTYYYKIERMMLGSESEIVGAISVKVVELLMKNEGKEAMGLQLHQPVVIEHQNKKEPTENQSGTH